MDKLRECPCCGGEGVLCHVKMLGNAYYLKFKVECIKCHLGTTNEDSPEEALKKWNARYEPPYNGSVPAGNERLGNGKGKQSKKALE